MPRKPKEQSSEQILDNVISNNAIVSTASSILEEADYYQPLNEEDVITQPAFISAQPQITKYMPEVLEVVVPKITRVKGRVAIKPYSSGEEKMGLELTGDALFPGTYQIDHMGLSEKNGFKTYITGLDEQVPEIQLLPHDQKVAHIRNIREVVAYLENVIANNYDINKETCMENYGSTDPNKKDTFWSKVTTFNSSGPDTFDAKGNRKETYWDKVELKLDNKGKVLDMTDPHDLVILHAIESRGLSLVAPSLQIAMDEPGYNFYLDQPEETSTIKTVFKKMRNKAGGYLESLSDTDERKLFYMTKLCAISGSSLYKRGGPAYTPKNQMYDDLCNFLDGKTEEKDIHITVKRFLDYYDMPIDELNRRTVLKDAVELRQIEPRGDGTFYYLKMNTSLGKSIEEMAIFMKAKGNENIWDNLNRDVEKYWTS